MEPYSTEPVIIIEEVFPQDTNSYGTLFGGRLMSLMDKAAGIVCSKFAHREFVTISIDTLKFLRPAHQGDLIEITSKVVFTSTHSAACRVIAKRINKSDWKGEDICTGYFFMVAIDGNGRPVPIPQFTPQNEAEELEWKTASEIRNQLLKHKKNRNSQD